MRGGIKLVRSTKQLQAIKQLGNTIYLRKNIEQITVTDEFTGESREEWQADEVSFEKKNPDLQKIHDNFELYWNWAEEKEQKKKIEKEKEQLVRELVDNKKLADLKDVVDTLVAENL